MHRDERDRRMRFHRCRFEMGPKRTLCIYRLASLTSAATRSWMIVPDERLPASSGKNNIKKAIKDDKMIFKKIKNIGDVELKLSFQLN